MSTRNHWSLPIRAFVITAGAIVVAALLSCSDSEPPTEPVAITPADSPTAPARGFFLGLLPSPSSSQLLDASYAQAAQYAEFAPVWAVGVGAQGFWNYAEALAGFGGDAIVDGLISDNGLYPIIHFSFIDVDTLTGDVILEAPPGLSVATLSDTALRRAYKNEVLDAVRASRPRYFSIGNEVNRWYEQYGTDAADPNGFQHWVSLYNETCDAVKHLSLGTQVFCVFAREMVAELKEADLRVLDLFDSNRMDLLIFTSYPNAVKKDSAGAMLPTPINRPTDIPPDYYSRILMPGKAFGFSEISWPSENGSGGEQDQADFLTLVAGSLTLDRGIDLRMFGWSWLHNLINPATQLEGSSGLISYNGTAKIVYGFGRHFPADVIDPLSGLSRLVRIRNQSRYVLVALA